MERSEATAAWILPACLLLGGILAISLRGPVPVIPGPSTLRMAPFHAVALPDRFESWPDGPVISILWPRGTVEVDDLRHGFLLETGFSYEGNGELVFHRGSELLYSDPLTSTKPLVHAALPMAVVSALGEGASVTWGVRLSGNRSAGAFASVRLLQEADKRQGRLRHDLRGGTYTRRLIVALRRVVRDPDEGGAWKSLHMVLVGAGAGGSGLAHWADRMRVCCVTRRGGGR